MTATHILGSFHFFRRVDLTASLRASSNVDFLADSGAFSAFNSGATVTVADYAAWLVDHQSVINGAATLDVIGNPVATARNTDELIERTGGAVPILPVFHVSSPWHELERLCREHPYVMLGGAVSVSGRGKTDAMLRWCVKAHRIAREHDVRLHGLGLTRPPYPEKLPWYSTDSSYWTSATRTGTLSLFDGARLQTFRCGTKRVEDHVGLIRAYGGNPDLLRASGFGIVREVGPRARADRDWLRQASLHTWRRYEMWLRKRKATVPPPRGGRTVGDGPKVYLAVSDMNDIRDVLRAHRGVPAVT